MSEDYLSDDYFGLYTDVPVKDGIDIIALAWARYDEIAINLDRLVKVYLEASRAVSEATKKEFDAHADKEYLMGECECPDDERTTCPKCAAYARVIEWSKQR